MNVHVRFFTVSAALALLAVSGSSLAAQSSPSGATSFAAVGMIPSSLLPVSDTATPVDSASASTASADASTAATTIARGPSLQSARVASHAVSNSRNVPTPLMQNRTSNRNSVALMIVGGAALVVGAVIGDDAGTLVMLGGAAVGLYGLYLFLT